MLVDLNLESAPLGEMTVITTEEDVRLSLPADAALAIDAVATGSGVVEVTDFDWKISTGDRESRLAQTLGRGGPRAVLRNAGGDIVISRRK